MVKLLLLKTLQQQSLHSQRQCRKLGYIRCFHRYVRDGAYTRDWGTDSPIEFDSCVGSE